MRKTYMQPSVEVVYMEVENVVCGSDLLGIGADYNGTNSLLGKDRNDFDDEAYDNGIFGDDGQGSLGGLW